MAVITLKGKELKTIGALPKIGSQAPDFTVTKTDLSEFKLKDCLGKKTVISMFPSIDTPTCSAAMLQFNEKAAALKHVNVLCVSADLPFALTRFCNAGSLTNIIPTSTFRHPEFGIKYGATIKEGALSGLLSRAIVIIDEKGKVIYTQQVPELSHEPDYAAILDAVK